jgi:hypothetical protein
VLRYHAVPGDILLFHCHGPVTKAQRSVRRQDARRGVGGTSLTLYYCIEQVTGSEWDHIALVVPGDGAADLQLLEATGEGVVVSPMVRTNESKKRCQLVV